VVNGNVNPAAEANVSCSKSMYSGSDFQLIMYVAQ
jgi:hypothetical protein